MMPAQDFLYIDNTSDLDDFVKKIENTKWLAIDTEFIRERSYYPKLCLIQVATMEHLACIDPLSISHLDSLFSLLHNKNIIKVLHSAYQDMEIFYQLSGKVPTPIFDSQLAAAVLGIAEQVGYGVLVQEELGVHLDKSQARTNWKQRPLRPEQLSYAIDDVRYLRQVYLRLQKRLQKLQRESWLQASFDRLGRSDTYDVQFDTLWRKIRGFKRLKGQQLAILQRLSIWRERTAIDRDLPRRWVCADDVLFDLARYQPVDIQGISSIRGVHKDKHQSFYQTWLKTIEEGKKIPKSEWPKSPKIQKITAKQSIILDLLMTVVRLYAQHHEIAPSILASRKDLETMLKKNQTELDQGWRGNLLNDVFAKLLSGQCHVSVSNGEVVLLNNA